MNKYNGVWFKRKFVLFLAMVLLLAMSINISSCSVFAPMKVKAGDLMEGIKANTIEGKKADDVFVANAADFTVELFKKSIDKEKNSLVSPISVMLALAMTANGAHGETLAEMERVLGGDIPLNDLNEYLYHYANNLPNGNKSKLEIANSIWFRDEENRLTVENDFLQKNADYYDAQAYKSPFNNETLVDINNWVKQHTDGMIDKILDKIEDDDVMYLINAIVFDAEWKKVYDKGDIYKRDFMSIDGTKQNTDFMKSDERLYLDDGKATGFIKPYHEDKYSFVALLPEEGIAIGDYIETLTGETLLDTINKAENTSVSASMPKFSYEYEIELNDILKALGMPLGFDAGMADFTKLGKSSRGNIFIGEVLHKTFISLDELGTKAGAVTKVTMKDEAAAMDLKTVILDRPFVYAIIDNSTNLPIFIGTVMDIRS